MQPCRCPDFCLMKVGCAEAVSVKLYFQTPPISKLDAAALASLKGCEHLALSTNCIERLVNLSGMEKLKILSIGRNKVTAICVSSLSLSVSLALCLSVSCVCVSVCASLRVSICSPLSISLSLYLSRLTSSVLFPLRLSPVFSASSCLCLFLSLRLTACRLFCLPLSHSVSHSPCVALPASNTCVWLLCPPLSGALR